MTWADQFDLPNGRYLLSHSVGCLPKGARQALEDGYLAPWADAGGDAWPKWLSTIEGFCEQLAGLLEVNAADICPQPSVSAGFANYLSALCQNGHRNGRRKILMHADAFPTMGFVVQGLQSSGLDLVLIDEGEPADDLDTWARYMDDTILAALITHVHSNTGVVSPVREISDLCHANGTYAVADVAQSVGILPVTPTKWGIDALFGSCVKWLCGGPGAGYLWMKQHHAQALMPPHVGWFSHADPFEFDIRNFQPADGARRFWGGTPSVAPYAIAEAAIKTLTAIGFETIREHNRTLKKMALLGLENKGLTARQTDASGGTLCLRLDAEAATKLCNTLSAEHCFFDRRQNTVRLSFHIFNTQEDAQFINEVLQTIY